MLPQQRTVCCVEALEHIVPVKKISTTDNNKIAFDGNSANAVSG